MSSEKKPPPPSPKEIRVAVDALDERERRGGAPLVGSGGDYHLTSYTVGALPPSAVTEYSGSGEGASRLRPPPPKVNPSVHVASVPPPTETSSDFTWGLIYIALGTAIIGGTIYYLYTCRRRDPSPSSPVQSTPSSASPVGEILAIDD